jgi:hypothetical protein
MRGLTATDILSYVHNELIKGNSNPEESRVLLSKPVNFLLRSEQKDDVWGVHTMATVLDYTPFNKNWAISLARYFYSNPDEEPIERTSLAAFPMGSVNPQANPDYLFMPKHYVQGRINALTQEELKGFNMVHATTRGLSLPPNGFANRRLDGSPASKGRDDYKQSGYESWNVTLYKTETADAMLQAIQKVLKKPYRQA